MVRERNISRNSRTKSAPSPNRPTVNCLGVSSIKQREMGGALGMQASRAAKRMAAKAKAVQQQQADDDDYYMDDLPAPTNSRGRASVASDDDVPLRGTVPNTRRSIFQRRPGTTPANSAQSRQTGGRTMLQKERGPISQPNINAPVPREDWIKVMVQVDEMKKKMAILGDRIGGLSDQVMKRSAGNPDDLEDITNDINDIVDKLEEHGQTLEEVKDIIDLVHDMDSQMRELFDASHFFYAHTTKQVPCHSEPSFDSEGAGYIGEGERVILAFDPQAHFLLLRNS